MLLMPNVLHVLPYVHIQFARNLERLAVNSGLFANIGNIAKCNAIYLQIVPTSQRLYRQGPGRLRWWSLSEDQ